MTPHLHPRSRLTSSLFATTLFASFFVVALPHVLPCPAPRVLYADDGTPIPRRRRRQPMICETDEKDDLEKEDGLGEEGEDGEGMKGIRERMKRECPVPKPGVLVGEILGFKSSTGEGKGRPP